MNIPRWLRIHPAVLLLPLPYACDAGSTLDRAVDFPGDGTVEISNTAGSVEVQGWDRERVEITGRIGDDVEDVEVVQDGDRLRIEVHIREGRSSDGDADLRIRMPAAGKLEATGVSADIRVSGIEGGQRLHTVSGNADTEARAAPVEVHAVSGDIEVEADGHGEGDVRVETVSGDATVRGAGGEVWIESVSGDARLVSGTPARIHMKSVSGDVELRAALGGSVRARLETVNGDVTVLPPSEPDAEIEIETFNGDIDNCFGPEAEPTRKYGPGQSLRFVSGDGGGDLRIKTLNGDIELCTG